MLLKPTVHRAARSHNSVVLSRARRSLTRLASTSDDKIEQTGPTPQRFGVADGQLVSVAGAALPALLRLGSGALVQGYSASLQPADPSKYSLATVGGQRLCETSAVTGFNRPAQPIILYEFEGCPFCRKVREMVSILDLDVLYRPCPQNGTTYRPEAKERGGKARFPYMVDPNTNTEMYESDDIIQYLADNYGDGTVPLGLRLGMLTVLSAGVSMLGRAGKGSSYTPANMPEEPLVIWSYEASPFCKLVREKLCELEIPHIQKSCARGSPKRQELFDRVGTFQAPFLQDPNTGAAMFESAAIVEYLERTYKA